MDITISMLDGTSHSLRVNPQDTVGSLKTRIHEIFQVPPQKQRLVFDNGQKTTLTEDSRLVSYYGLQSGSRVSLLVTQPATIQVFLRNEKGQVNTYDIKPNETVSNFKTKVQCREGVQANQQRLLYQSREMMDGSLLSDYNVKEMSSIDLMLRLRGG